VPTLSEKPIKATDALRADHKMVRKLLETLTFDNPRFAEVAKTLHRVLVGHAWFEDTILLPALEADPLLQRRFAQEIGQEHKDLQLLMKLIRETPVENKKEMEAYALQFHAILDTHFQKEEAALFPLAERILDSEGLNELGAEMKRRQTEIRNLVQD
jgi:hemerythrin-like domain-containing protein